MDGQTNMELLSNWNSGSKVGTSLGQSHFYCGRPPTCMRIEVERPQGGWNGPSKSYLDNIYSPSGSTLDDYS